MHGFYVDSKKMTISFDLVFDFSEKRVNEIISEIMAAMKEKYPKYRINIIEDKDFSD